MNNKSLRLLFVLWFFVSTGAWAQLKIEITGFGSNQTSVAILPLKGKRSSIVWTEAICIVIGALPMQGHSMSFGSTKKEKISFMLTCKAKQKPTCQPLKTRLL